MRALGTTLVSMCVVVISASPMPVLYADVTSSVTLFGLNHSRANKPSDEPSSPGRTTRETISEPQLVWALAQRWKSAYSKARHL